jgi:hypothetical protein
LEKEADQTIGFVVVVVVAVVLVVVVVSYFSATDVVNETMELIFYLQKP